MIVFIVRFSEWEQNVILVSLTSYTYFFAQLLLFLGYRGHYACPAPHEALHPPQSHGTTNEYLFYACILLSNSLL